MAPEFRVWDTENNLYSTNQVYYYMSPEGEVYDSDYGELDSDVTNTVIVEQYTGLKDVKGNKIFEGDILKVSDGENFYVAPVRYHSDDNYPAFDIDIRYVPSDWNYDDNIFSEILNYGNEVMTVIGNVHENPELLEADK